MCWWVGGTRERENAPFFCVFKLFNCIFLHRHNLPSFTFLRRTETKESRRRRYHRYCATAVPSNTYNAPDVALGSGSQLNCAESTIRRNTYNYFACGYMLLIRWWKLYVRWTWVCVCVCACKRRFSSFSWCELCTLAFVSYDIIIILFTLRQSWLVRGSFFDRSASQ